MFIDELKSILIRDLNRLEKELNSYEKEENIWKISGSISNSSGHLTLHICGNLRHFICHVLGKSDYTRNRELEFNSPPVAREILVREINNTVNEVTLALERLDPIILNQIYPINVFKKEMTTQYFLIHLSGHLNYHLGQINSMRRMLD